MRERCEELEQLRWGHPGLLLYGPWYISFLPVINEFYFSARCVWLPMKVFG